MATVTPTGPIFKPMNGASATVTNTTAATIFLDSSGNEIIQQIPKDTLKPGETYEIFAAYTLVATNSTDTFAIDLRVVDNASTPNSTDYVARAAFDGANSDRGVFHGYATCTATGTSGTLLIIGQFMGLEAGSAVYASVRSSATVDTTTDVDFKAEVTMSVASAGNQIQLDQLALRKAGYGDSPV